jgi:hypothetical protein
MRYSVFARWSALVSVVFAVAGWALLLVRLVIDDAVPGWGYLLVRLVGDPKMMYTLQDAAGLLMVPAIVLGALAGRRGLRGLVLGILGILVSAITAIM